MTTETPIPSASEFDPKDPRIIVIGNRPAKEYYWVIGLKLQWNHELIIHYMAYRSMVVTRLLDLYKQFGIQEVRGSRKEVMVKGKGGEPLTIIELIIKKPGMLLP